MTEKIRNSAVTTKVARKINFSAPLRVNEAELAERLKPVPLTCMRIKITIIIAQILCKISNVSFIVYIIQLRL